MTSFALRRLNRKLFSVLLFVAPAQVQVTPIFLIMADHSGPSIMLPGKERLMRVCLSTKRFKGFLKLTLYHAIPTRRQSNQPETVISMEYHVLKLNSLAGHCELRYSVFIFFIFKPGRPPPGDCAACGRLTNWPEFSPWMAESSV
jgi:hypothetical protein